MRDTTAPLGHPDDTKAAAAFGSPVRIAILRYLAQHPGALSGDLSHTLGLAQATISTNLTVLERHGLVTADVPSPSRKGRRAHWTADAHECDRLIRHLHEHLVVGPEAANTSKR